MRGDVTVAIATLDRPEGLRRCVEALLAGSRLPDEIIVVDQGDATRTETVLGSFEGSPVPILHERQDRRGLSASRNAAIGRARSEILAVTDDDCRPDRDWLRAIVAAFAEDPDLSAVCGSVLADGEAGDGEPASLRTSPRRAVFEGRAIAWEVGTGGNFACRRARFAIAGGYDERLGAGSPGRAGEDLDMIHRLLRDGARIAYEPDAIVFHAPKQRGDERAATEGYGYGIGALCGIGVRRNELWLLVMLTRWFEMRLRIVRGARRGSRLGRARAEAGVMVATLRGLLYGLTHSRRHRMSIGGG